MQLLTINCLPLNQLLHNTQVLGDSQWTAYWAYTLEVWLLPVLGNFSAHYNNFMVMKSLDNIFCITDPVYKEIANNLVKFTVSNMKLGWYPGHVLNSSGVEQFKLEYYGMTISTWSIPWLLMPWLLESPGHQQPWYWLCRINGYLSSTRKAFNYLHSLSVEKWLKMQIWFCVSWNEFSMAWVNSETKWPPFHRRFFQMHFLQWKCINSN